jgi:hypothetical protein
MDHGMRQVPLAAQRLCHRHRRFPGSVAIAYGIKDLSKMPLLFAQITQAAQIHPSRHHRFYRHAVSGARKDGLLSLEKLLDHQNPKPSDGFLKRHADG